MLSSLYRLAGCTKSNQRHIRDTTYACLTATERIDASFSHNTMDALLLTRLVLLLGTAQVTGSRSTDNGNSNKGRSAVDLLNSEQLINVKESIDRQTTEIRELKLQLQQLRQIVSDRCRESDETSVTEATSQKPEHKPTSVSE